MSPSLSSRIVLLAVVAGVSLAPSVAFAQQAGRWVPVIERARHALVVIETDSVQGSGFIVQPDGTLITNAHVISDASSITVTTAAGDVYRRVYVLAEDRSRDIAILRVDGFELPTLPLGSPTDIAVGEEVLVLGAPLGLEQSASVGIVGGYRLTQDGTRVIQTTAPASSGSSGGPLLNADGQVVGVISFTVVRSQNLNFAVPINYARGLLDSIRLLAQKPLRVFDTTGLPASSSGAFAGERGGIVIDGYGQPAVHLGLLYLELVNFLATNGVRVRGSRDPSDTRVAAVSLPAVLERARQIQAEGILYVVLDAGNAITDRLRVQLIDLDGKIVWQEQTTSTWQWTGEDSVRALVHRMNERLLARIRSGSLPSSRVEAPATAVEPSPPADAAPPDFPTEWQEWTTSLPDTFARVRGSEEHVEIVLFGASEFSGYLGVLRLESPGRYSGRGGIQGCSGTGGWWLSYVEVRWQGQFETVCLEQPRRVGFLLMEPRNEKEPPGR